MQPDQVGGDSPVSEDRGSSCGKLAKFWWAAKDSNLLPQRYQHCALPDELHPENLWWDRWESNPLPSA